MVFVIKFFKVLIYWLVYEKLNLCNVNLGNVMSIILIISNNNFNSKCNNCYLVWLWVVFFINVM